MWKSAQGEDNFLILTFFLIIFKNNPWQILYAPGDPFGRAWLRGAAASLSRATCIGAVEVPCWPAAARALGAGPGLPCHMHRRGNLESSGPARPPFFLLLPFFLCPSSPASGGDATAAGRHTPKSGDLWWGKCGKSTPVSLGRYCPYLISVLALSFPGFCMYRGARVWQ
jgi:hypothetical protein